MWTIQSWRPPCENSEHATRNMNRAPRNPDQAKSAPINRIQSINPETRQNFPSNPEQCQRRGTCTNTHKAARVRQVAPISPSCQLEHVWRQLQATISRKLPQVGNSNLIGASKSPVGIHFLQLEEDTFHRSIP